MTSQEEQQVEEMILRLELGMPEAEVLRLLADELDEFNPDDLEELFKSMVITVGFTIDQLDLLLDEFVTARNNATAPGGLVGWMFRYTKPVGNVNPLIRNIMITRMDLSVSATQSAFTETSLTYTDPDTNQPAPATITPKVFFQRREVGTDAMDVPYPEAYDETLPRVIELPDLPMYTLEGYYPWADLAMLQRGDIENFVDFILDGTTAYTDLFFSGANMEYATMHNPRMRLEQVNLKDSATGLPVPETEKHRPFTLKAEPYIAAETLTKEWIRQQAPSDSAPGTDEGEIPGETEGGRTPEQAEAFAVASLPMSAFMYPCPTVWDIGNQIGIQAARMIGATNSAVPLAYQNELMSRLYNPSTPSSEPITIKTITLSDIPPYSNPYNNNEEDKPTERPGCLSFLSTFSIALLVLWMLS